MNRNAATKKARANDPSKNKKGVSVGEHCFVNMHRIGKKDRKIYQATGQAKAPGQTDT